MSDARYPLSVTSFCDPAISSCPPEEEAPFTPTSQPDPSVVAGVPPEGSEPSSTDGFSLSETDPVTTSLASLPSTPRPSHLRLFQAPDGAQNYSPELAPVTLDLSHPEVADEQIEAGLSRIGVLLNAGDVERAAEVFDEIDGLARAYYRFGNFPQSDAETIPRWDRDLQYFEAVIGLLQNREEASRNASETLEMLDPQFAENPNDPTNYQMRATLYDLLHQYVEAIESLEAAAEISPELEEDLETYREALRQQAGEMAQFRADPVGHQDQAGVIASFIEEIQITQALGNDEQAIGLALELQRTLADEAASAGDETRRLYHQAHVELLEGNIPRARLLMMDFAEATEGTTDPDLQPMQEEVRETLGNFSLQAIDQLIAYNEEIIRQQIGDEDHPGTDAGYTFDNEAMGNGRRGILTRMRALIESGRVVTLDDAMEIEHQGHDTRLNPEGPLGALYQLETREGLERLADPLQRRAYLLEVAERLDNRDGAYSVAGVLLGSLFQDELQEAGSLERLNEMYESGELSRRDPITDRAWEIYNDDFDPLGETWNLSSTTWDAVTHEAILTGVTLPATIGVGTLVRAGLGGTSFITNLAARGRGGAALAETLLVGAGGVAEGIVWEGQSVFIEGRSFDPAQAGLNTLMSLAFHGGGRLWGRVGQRLEMNPWAVGAETGRIPSRFEVGLRQFANFAGSMTTQTAVSTGFGEIQQAASGAPSEGTFLERLSGHFARMLGYHFAQRGLNLGTDGIFQEIEGQTWRNVEAARQLGEVLRARQSARPEAIVPNPETAMYRGLMEATTTSPPPEGALGRAFRWATPLLAATSSIFDGGIGAATAGIVPSLRRSSNFYGYEPTEAAGTGRARSLDPEMRARLLRILERSLAEGERSDAYDATVRPDDPFSLVATVGLEGEDAVNGQHLRRLADATSFPEGTEIGFGRGWLYARIGSLREDSRMRIYLNVNRAYADRIWQEVSDIFARARELGVQDLTAKISMQRSEFDRSDPIVLYVDARNYEAVQRLVLDGITSDCLDPEVPGSALRIRDGIGVGQDPGDGGSFNGLFADALERARQVIRSEQPAGRQVGPDRALDILLEELARAGVAVEEGDLFMMSGYSEDPALREARDAAYQAQEEDRAEATVAQEPSLFTPEQEAEFNINTFLGYYAEPHVRRSLEQFVEAPGVIGLEAERFRQALSDMEEAVRRGQSPDELAPRLEALEGSWYHRLITAYDEACARARTALQDIEISHVAASLRSGGTIEYEAHYRSLWELRDHIDRTRPGRSFADLSPEEILSFHTRTAEVATETAPLELETESPVGRIIRRVTQIAVGAATLYDLIHGGDGSIGIGMAAVFPFTSGGGRPGDPLRQAMITMGQRMAERNWMPSRFRGSDRIVDLTLSTAARGERDPRSGIDPNENRLLELARRTGSDGNLTQQAQDLRSLLDYFASTHTPELAWTWLRALAIRVSPASFDQVVQTTLDLYQQADRQGIRLSGAVIETVARTSNDVLRWLAEGSGNPDRYIRNTRQGANGELAVLRYLLQQKSTRIAAIRVIPRSPTGNLRTPDLEIRFADPEVIEFWDVKTSSGTHVVDASQFRGLTGDQRARLILLGGSFDNGRPGGDILINHIPSLNPTIWEFSRHLPLP